MIATIQVALVALFWPSPLATPKLQASFDKALEQSIERSGVPGGAVAVFQDGHLVFSKAFGVSNVAEGTPMTVDRQFEIGSLSKMFTAMGLLMLVHEGKLKLSENLGDTLPDLPETWRTATIEQTLHHMSGVPDYEEIAGYDFYNSPRTAKEIIDSAASKPLDFAHGTKFSYSNTGYYLLSMILEKRSGIPSGKFLEDRIFKTLGMVDTYADTLPTASKAAQGYHSRSGSRMPQPRIAWTSTLGAGGIVSTLADLGKWDAALYTEKLVPAALRDKMWETAKATDGTEVPYGFGWFVGQFRNVLRQSHTGQTNGFTCFYNRFPSLKYSVFSFSNTYGGRLSGLTGLVTAHFSPHLSYRGVVIPKDADPQRTALHLRALRQSVFGEGNMELLLPGIKDFASKPEFAKDRDEIKPTLETLKAFKYLRHGVRSSSRGEVEEFLYRLDHAGGETYWTLRFIGGKLASMNWELE